LKVLVTGVGGFVGGHLVEFLRAEHPDVEIFGLERAHGAASDALPAGVRSVPAELDDPASVDAALEGLDPERVIHLAGQSSVQQSWTDPGGTLRTNVLGLVHLVDALRRRGAPRLLIVGSADEYGPVAGDAGPIREDAPLRPTSPYAVSKAAQGLLALQYTGSGGLPVILTRTFPHTGPRRGEAFAESSFARQIAEIEAGLRPPVLKVGNLEAIRDFTDVRDVVRAYWALLERGRPGEVYNVCSGRGLRIREVLERLLALAGVAVEVSVDPERLRPSDIPTLVGDRTRLKLATGWEPRIPIETTLADLLNDWRTRVGAGR
jgi:GDP-4-dehydro-6-deoxy-D-mannose reductase